MKVCLIYGKINALSRLNLNYHPVVRVYFDRYTRRHVDDLWGECSRCVSGHLYSLILVSLTKALIEINTMDINSVVMKLPGIRKESYGQFCPNTTKEV